MTTTCTSFDAFKSVFVSNITAFLLTIGVSCPVGYTCRISILFCYKYYPTRKARADAEAQCAGEGAELAIIDNVDKDNEIFSYISKSSSYIYLLELTATCILLDSRTKTLRETVRPKATFLYKALTKCMLPSTLVNCLQYLITC